MAAYIGSHKIDKCYLGTQEIDKVMLGTHEVCSSAVADKPLTGDIEKILATVPHTHTNSGHTITMEDQPADKVFPNGQKVYVGGYQCDYALLQKAYDSGITVVGHHGIVRDNAHQLANAAAKGLMYMPLIREINGEGGGKLQKFGCYVDGTKQTHTCGAENYACVASEIIGQTRVNQYATDAMDKWRALDNDNIYGWMYCLDDCRTAVKKDTQTNALYEAMRDADPDRRVVGDFGLASSYENSDSGRHRLEQITFTNSQHYYHGGSLIGDGDGYHKSRAIIGKNAEVLKSNCEQVASNNGKPRTIVQGWIYAFAWNVVPSENGDPEYFRKQFVHDSLLSLMKGCNGVHWYQMSMNYGNKGTYAQRTVYCCPSEKAMRMNAVFWAMKLINKDNDVAKALVWGKRTSHEKSITVAGSNTYTYGKNKGTVLFPGYTENMINHQDIQFNGRRYVIVTNSTPTRAVVAQWKAHPGGVTKSTPNTAPDAAGTNDCNPNFSDDSKWVSAVPAPPKYDVPVTLSGFPHTADQLKQYVVTELVSGANVIPNSSGQIHTTMKPLESRIYEIKAAPGWGGEGPPPPAPVITTHPVGGTFAVGAATPVFTVGYTPPTASVQWQWQHLGSGKTWKDIPGATSDTYHMTQTHIESGHDGDEFRAKVTTSGNPSVYSNVATITVTGTAPPVFVPAVTGHSYVNKYSWPVTLSFNGTVKILNASNIRTIRTDTPISPISGWRYSRNAASAGNQLTFDVALAPSAVVYRLWVLLGDGAISVNGVIMPATKLSLGSG